MDRADLFVIIKYRLLNKAQIKAVVAGRIERVADVRQFLEASGELVRTAAVRNIKIGGDPPWPPSKKTLSETFVARTASKSLRIEPGDTVTRSGYGQTGVDLGVMMGSINWAVTSPTHVRIGTDEPYAFGFQFGTGELGVGPQAGHTAWTVKPVNRRALAWSVGGVTFFAREVTIPGQPPRPFLELTDQIVTLVLDELRARLAA